MKISLAELLEDNALRSISELWKFKYSAYDVLYDHPVLGL